MCKKIQCPLDELAKSRHWMPRCVSIIPGSIPGGSKKLFFWVNKIHYICSAIKNNFMKRITLSIFLLLSFCSFSQRCVSYVSKNRDTLYLPDNSIGRLIYYSWNNVPKKEWPIILFVEENLIAKLNGVKEEE